MSAGYGSSGSPAWEPLSIKREGERVLLDGHAPNRIGVTQELLDAADPKRIEWDGDYIYFDLDNANLTYRVLGWRDHAWDCEYVVGLKRQKDRERAGGGA